MIKGYYHIALFLSVLLLAVSSSCRVIDQQLDLAESLLNSNPDSALSLLCDLDSVRFTSSGGYARFALLKSIALDKSYIDETNDSLINVAVDYYSLKGPSEQKMKAWYYQGVIRFNAGNLPAATVSLERAEKEALSNGDYHYLGLIYRYLAYVFNQSNNLVETVNYAKKSLQAFEYNNEGLYVDYAKSALGVALMNNLEYEEARLYFHELLTDNIEIPLRTEVESCLADTYVMHGDSIERAIELYSGIQLEKLPPLSMSYYAMALALNGNRKEADWVLNNSYSAARSHEEKAAIDYAAAVIDSINGNYRNAYIKTRTAAQVQDSLTRDLLRQSTIAAQRDYYRSETTIRDGLVKRQRIMLILGGIIGVLTILSGLLFVLVWIQRRDASLKEQMTKLSLINKTIQKDNKQLIGALFFERISRLCSISSAYYSSFDKGGKEKYLSQFKRGIREIQGSRYLFEGLEIDLNKYCSNVMKVFREQVTEMSVQHYRFVCLFFAGIPNEIIQLIMACNSVASVRTMRSRIRNEIKNAGARDEALFIDYLESRKQPPKNTQE